MSLIFSFLIVVIFFMFSQEAIAQKQSNRFIQQDTLTWEKNVTRDQETQIWFGFALNQNCETLRGWNVTISRMPKRGSVNLKRRQAQVTPAWSSRPHMNHRQSLLAQRCVGSNVLVITVQYRPNTKFVGMDNTKGPLT
jgi:hypothetical protein